jgi:hypothetical protein
VKRPPIDHANPLRTGNDQLEDDQTLAILLGFARGHFSIQGREMSEYNGKERIKMDSSDIGTFSWFFC